MRSYALGSYAQLGGMPFDRRHGSAVSPMCIGFCRKRSSKRQGKNWGGFEGHAMPGSLQDSYLAEIKRQGVPVTVYLVNGFQLRGLVKGFDPFTILIEYERKTHLIYKHAVSTISPQGPFATPGDAPAAAPPEAAEVTTS